MKIEQLRTLSGPNVYTYKPALLMQLDLEDLTGKESFEITGFNENLLALIPELEEHTCGAGHAGGFVERLREGTYFGHIVEHIAIELSHLAKCDIGVNHGKTRRAGWERNIYNVIVEYKAERAMRHLLERAVEIVEKLVTGEPLENLRKLKDETLAEARRLVARYELGPSTRSIVEAAGERNIPVRRLGEASLVQLGYGKNLKRIQAATTSNTSAIAVEIAGDKDLAKQILREAEIPVPYGEVVCTTEEAVAAFREIGSPVVVKPLDGRQGKGVSLNLTTEEEIIKAFEIAREYSDCILVEEMFTGLDYRVLIIGGKMVAASLRREPQIIGDGSSTIRELIEKENQNSLRGDGHEKPLTKIKLDEITIETLAKQKLDADCVPRAGEIVILREGCNLSTGGTAKDVTDDVHPQIKSLCERAARLIGLDVCGIDLVTNDISEPLEKGAGGFIELNAAPGLRMHTNPSEGKSRNIGREIIEMLYPSGTESRIPIISVTGTNGKTTVTRMIAHVFSHAGTRVGMTTTSGIWIGGECVTRGDTTGPRSARVVLSDPTVEVAVLETARGGIVKKGLGYDWSDVAVLTNIQEDHIGQDGIESVEDILHIKSLVAERVREGGTIVLNADDELLARLAEDERIREIERKIVYFSLRANHILLRRHILAGGTVYTVRNNWIVEMTRQSERQIARVEQIPATMSGLAEFNIANSLAAIATCRAQGISAEQIIAALAEFSNTEHNHGRLNLFNINDGYVLIDYAHNPEAIQSICRMAANWHDGRRVSGIITVPGDRANALVEEVGRVAARGFHRVVIREDADLRGRRKGEIAQILYEAVKGEVPDRDCRVILDESEALRREISVMREGDVVVCFYENFELVQSILARCDAEPVNDVETIVSTFGAHAFFTA